MNKSSAFGAYVPQSLRQLQTQFDAIWLDAQPTSALQKWQQQLTKYLATALTTAEQQQLQSKLQYWQQSIQKNTQLLSNQQQQIKQSLAQGQPNALKQQQADQFSNKPH